MKNNMRAAAALADRAGNRGGSEWLEAFGAATELYFDLPELKRYALVALDDENEPSIIVQDLDTYAEALTLLFGGISEVPSLDILDTLNGRFVAWEFEPTLVAA